MAKTMNIQQVANKLSLSPDTIRRWERLGIIPPVKRDADGFREFNDEAVEWVQYAQLLNMMHVSEDFQIEYVKLAMLGKNATPARQNLLHEQLAKLKDDHQCLLDRINQMEEMVENKKVS